MRIVGGKYKGKHIHVNKNLKARPTTDFAKESLFNILSNHFHFEEIKVLDLFAGTGSISFEFASRGSECVDLVEKDQYNFSMIKKGIGLLHLDTVNCIKADAFLFIEKCNKKYDIVFADPPYDLKQLEDIPGLIFTHHLLEKDGWLILEHSGKQNFSNDPHLFDHRRYGSVNFSFFKL